MCGLRLFDPAYVEAINLQTHNSPDLLLKFPSLLAMIDLHACGVHGIHLFFSEQGSQCLSTIEESNTRSFHEISIGYFSFCHSLKLCTFVHCITFAWQRWGLLSIMLT